MGSDNLKKVWPDWKIVELMGEGSYGKVYKAAREDHGISSYAAVKVISIPQNDAETESLRMEGLDEAATKTYFEEIVKDFVSEIKLMESLKGTPNIVSVEDYKVVEKKDKIGWDIYIRMELLTSFNDYACDKKLTENDVIKLGTDICSALELCAQRGIIHRDIKPENIFISDFGFFKLGDFGIARQIEKTVSSLSRRGTLNFMAPEVSNGSDYDSRADIYSLGIVLYKLLNNSRLPFLDPYKQLIQYQDRVKAVEKRMGGEPLPAPVQASDELAAVILKACAFKPEDRFENPTQMRAALKSLKCPAPGVPSSEQNENSTPEIKSEITEKAQFYQPIESAESYSAKDPGKNPSRMFWTILMATVLLVACLAGIYALINKFSDKNPVETTATQTTNQYISENSGTTLNNTQTTTAAASTSTTIIPVSQTTTKQTTSATSAPKAPDGKLSANTKRGDKVKFGNYEQDNITGNGKEPIEWIVLYTGNNKALLLSRKILDSQAYNASVDNSIAWEKCSLYNWLNYNFRDTAFNSTETAMIETITLLSYSDVTNTAYGFSPYANVTDKARRAQGTVYAISKGLLSSNDDDLYAGDYIWWLQSSNEDVIYEDGSFGNYMGSVSDSSVGVRPAIWVNLPS
ncbi:MAG: protein kinase [Eubacteriales bacterium]